MLEKKSSLALIPKARGIFAHLLTEQEYDDCLAQLPGAISAVAHYWAEAPATPEEIAGASDQPADSDVRRKRGGQWVH